jgi:hypothetical protein
LHHTEKLGSRLIRCFRERLYDLVHICLHNRNATRKARRLHLCGNRLPFAWLASRAALPLHSFKLGVQHVTVGNGAPVDSVLSCRDSRTIQSDVVVARRESESQRIPSHGSDFAQGLGNECRCCSLGVITSVVRLRSGARSVVIPCAVSVLNSDILAEHWPNLSETADVTFQAESQLSVIRESCFAHCPLASISIPGSVRILGSACFEYARIDAFRIDFPSQLLRLPDRGFGHAMLKSICVPRTVQVISELSFEYAELESLTSEPGSQLIEVAASCFFYCSLKSITIPPSVKVLGKSCFQCSGIQSVKFKKGSGLAQIDELCFAHCALQGICIPASVKLLGMGCFMCESNERNLVRAVTFEPNSQMTRMEERCFVNC